MNSRSNSIFDSLWSDYVAFNPQAKKIYDEILAHEKTVDASVDVLINDHVALRTFDHPKIGITAMAKHFEAIGYKAKGEYVFTEKKLFARHYEHSDPNQPKVFISELKTSEFSPYLKEKTSAVVETIVESQVYQPEFLWSGRSWQADHATYEQLLKESEYAAWVYAFGFRSNHFTISVNHLKSFDSLETLNSFVKSKGYALNSSGGEVKGTPEQLLVQSSTLAEKAKVPFTEGTREIPACYYEFARRYAAKDGKLYQGFIAASADKIFESTNTRK